MDETTIYNSTQTTDDVQAFNEIESILNSVDTKAKILILKKLTLKIALGNRLSSKMADTELATEFCTRFEGLKNLAKEATSRDIYQYKNCRWIAKDNHYTKDVIAKICSVWMQCSYNKIISIANTIEKLAPTKPIRKAGLIAVLNGVIDTRTRQFKQHDKSYGVQSCIDVVYSQSATECPVFDRYIEQLADGSAERKEILLAFIYYHMANRYDKKIFTELVGEGDTGKTTLTNFIVMIVGEEATKSIDLRAIDGDKKNNHATEGIDKCSMLLSTETPVICGEFPFIKSVSGGDPILINPKNKPAYHAHIHATMLLVGNNPIVVIEKTSAMYNRRVTIKLTKEFKDVQQDPHLLKKLKLEIPAIINKLLVYMTKSKFDAILSTAIDGKDKLGVIYDTDNVCMWIKNSILVTNEPLDFLQVGTNAQFSRETKDDQLKRASKKLYENYLLWCVAGSQNKAPLTLQNFMKRTLLHLHNIFKLKKTFQYAIGKNNVRILNGVTFIKNAFHLQQIEENSRNPHSFLNQD